MGVPTNFAVNAAPGGYKATWVNDSSLNATNVLSMTLVYTTTEANASFQTIILEPTSVNGIVINSYMLTNLATGFTYQMSLQIASTDDNYSGTSNVVEFSVVSVPSKPVFKVTAGDKLLFFSLLNASQLPITLADVGTLFDGFEDLNKIEISLSDKTSGDGYNISLESDPSNNFYKNGGFSIDATNFTNMKNDHTYAVALTYFNSLGKSLISDTLFFTPSELPIDMDVAAVEAINVNDDKTGALVFWNPPYNTLTGIQSVSQVKSYSVWRALVDASGVVGAVATQIMIDTSDNNTDIQVFDNSNNYIPYVFDNVSYKFCYNDSAVSNGTKYRYYLTAKNQYGSSTTKDSSSYADVLVGGIPIAPVVTATPSDQQLKLSVNTASKLNGLQSSGKVYVKLYASSQIELTDASQNALHGYNWTQMALDASSCVTLTGLNNGTYYGASVKIETQSNVLPASKYLSAPGQLSTAAAPYKAPSVPTGLVISPLDASGNPLSNKLNLSWNAQTYLAANGFGPDASVNFVITRHEGLDGSGNEIGHQDINPSPATKNSHQDNDLTNDKTYFYALKANVNNLESPESTPEVVSAPFSKPTSVTNLSADCSGNGNIFVKWDNIADASANYELKIFKGTNAAVTIYPVSSGVILGDNLNLVLCDEYTIEIRSVISRISQSFYSDKVDTKTFPFLTPGQVQDLQLSVSSTQIFAVWEKPLNMDASGVINGVKITGYDVVLQDAFGIDISGIYYSTNTLYQLITGLTNGTTYRVKVLAKGNAGITGAGKAVAGSHVNSGDVLVNPGPNPATFLTSEASDRTIKLNWVHSDAQVSNFKVYQGYVLLNNPTPVFVNEGLYNQGGVVGNKWTTTITGLTNGQSYHFEVIASKSSIDSTGVVRDDTPFKAPSAPTAAAQPFSVASNSLTLNWGVPVDNGGSNTIKYKVEIFDTYNNTLSDASGVIVKFEDNINVVTLNESSQVQNGKSYYAKVKAYYTIDESTPTSVALRIPASGSIKVNDAPQNVTNLDAVSKDKSVKLTWTDPSDVVNYPYTTTIVQRSEDNNIFVQVGAVSRVGSFTDSNLMNGKSYTYKVIAQHSNNSAQQPDGVTKNVTPAGLPIFEVSSTYNNVDASGNLDFKLSYNRNGSDVTTGVFIGIDFSGIAHVVTNPDLTNKIALEAATFNGQPCLTSETFKLTLPRIDGETKIKDLLFILGNAAGAKVGSWPIPPNAFDKQH